MSVSLSLWQRLKGAVHRALFPRYWIAVLEQQPLRLVVSSDGRVVTADGRTCTVHCEERTLARFDAIQSVDVVHHPRDDGASKPEHWSITLYLGRSTRSFVGRSRKQADVDRIAHRLATLTGKPVRQLEALSHPSHIPSR